MLPLLLAHARTHTHERKNKLLACRFVCIRRLKSVRRQFNEYQTMKKTLLCLTVALLSYALVVVVLLAGQHVIVRRVAILCGWPFFFFSLSCRCVCCRVGTCVHRELLLHAALSSVHFSAPIRVASPRVFMCTLRGTILNPTLRSTECPTDPVITTYILLWGSIREPFTKKITGDDEYLWGYTKGFSELPSPAQVQQ